MLEIDRNDAVSLRGEATKFPTTLTTVEFDNIFAPCTNSKVMFVIKGRNMEKVLSIPQDLFTYLSVIVLFFVLMVFIRKSLNGSVKLRNQAKSASLLAMKPARLPYKYRSKSHIMTKREEKFFLLLCDIFRDKCYVIPQIHLSALLDHRIKGQNWKGAFAHINGKSVDYVLLRSRDLSVLCVVELDDSTHDTVERVERDREVEYMLSSANIPLVRLRSPENMSKQEIADSFAQVINKSSKSPSQIS